MGRRAKSKKKGKAEPVGPKPPKNEDSRFRDLEKRLEESLAREKATGALLQEQTRALTDAHAQITEALEQKAATSEILRVIASSQTDAQPVFDAIVGSAVRLLRGHTGALTRVAGDQVELFAYRSTNEAAAAALRALFPRSLQAGGPATQTVRDRAPVNIADQQTDPQVPEPVRAVARVSGHRSVVWVPLLRQDQAIGGIGITRREPGGFSDDEIVLLQTFADQAVIAIENVRLFKDLEARNGDLTESLDQQTATSEILRVISSSPTDAQPVFDTIVRSSDRLLGGLAGSLALRVGDEVHLVALTPTNPEGDAVLRRLYPVPIGQDGTHAEVVRLCRPRMITDTETELTGRTREFARIRGFRSRLSVPLIRDGIAIGSLGVTRAAPGAFTDREIALLQTFADQAVIAIENVRLFTELQEKNRALTAAHAQVTESLEQQTATSEILQVISRSPTSVQPVFDAIANSALLLCVAKHGNVFLFDGELIQLGAVAGSDPEGTETVRQSFPQVPGRASATTRAIETRQPVIIPDVLEDPEYSLTEMVRVAAYRSVMSVPMLRAGNPIGAITVTRAEAGPFADKQLALLQTFADQAVIAIENARLFTELQASNRDLTSALDTQTATSEILRVISRMQTDVQPVFDAIADSAARLCQADIAGLFRAESGQLHEISTWSRLDPDLAQTLRRIYPRPLDTSTFIGRSILERRVVQVADMVDPVAPHSAVGLHRLGFRSQLSVPMLRGSEPIGGIAVVRRTPGVFPDDQVQLLKTFADQAVIAIENVRLFSELRERTDDLQRSVDQLTALGEVGQAVSSTLDLDTVLTTIVARAVQLSGLDGGVVFEYDEGTETFTHRAAADTGGALAQARRGARYRKGEGALGRTAITLEPVQVPDITVPGAYDSHMRENLIESGVRAVLAVPMIHQTRLVGCLGVTRNQPGAFAVETVELLRTFATQSALAIQNARLFHEIEDKSRELQVASQHKSEFLANMSHELRTPLNAIIGYSEMLQEEAQDRRQDALIPDLEKINAAAKHQLSLINDILDLSKVEAGRMELELADFDLPTAIDGALTLVRERATRRGINLGGTIEDRIGSICADERKVKQVLLNLLSNALKFTPEGGRIEVRAAVREGRVEVSVTDTGVGIAPEDQEAIFEEFRQVGTADKRVEGTGLGLALSRKFIELHGGRIWVKSEEGQGSTFTLTLPMRREG